jgi:hypothetical protein
MDRSMRRWTDHRPRHLLVVAALVGNCQLLVNTRQSHGTLWRAEGPPRRSGPGSKRLLVVDECAGA